MSEELYFLVSLPYFLCQAFRNVGVGEDWQFAVCLTITKVDFFQVIIVEDDLEFAPDFLDYFRYTLPVLRKDKTLMCVSAWNDNGKVKRVFSPQG